MTQSQAVCALVILLLAFTVGGFCVHDTRLLFGVGYAAGVSVVILSSPWWIEAGRTRWSRFQKIRRCR